MKSKILAVVVIMTIVFNIFTISSFAAISSATASLTSNKSEYSLSDTNEVITVTLKLTNLQSTNGVIAYSGKLEYDKDKLTYLDISAGEGGKWSIPSYSEENGLLVADRANNEFPAEGENLCTIKFKPKAAGDNVSIKISDFTLSSGELNGSGSKKLGDVQTSVNIKTTIENSTNNNNNNNTNNNNTNNNNSNNNQNNGSNSGTNNGNTNSNNNNSGSTNGSNNTNNNNNGSNINSGSAGNNSNVGNSSNNSNNQQSNSSNNKNTNTQSSNNPTVADKKIPYSGASIYVIIPIGIAIIVTIGLYVRIKLIDQKIKKEEDEILN